MLLKPRLAQVKKRAVQPLLAVFLVHQSSAGLLAVFFALGVIESQNLVFSIKYHRLFFKVSQTLYVWNLSVASLK